MKKIAALFICIFMTFSVCCAEEFLDMPNNWATESLTNAVNNGLIGGSDGYIRPNDPMTRAEMAIIMVRAFGAEKEADISAFSDVKKEDWFYSAMAKAVEMGAFTGADGKLNPQNNITREETFAVLARMFSLDLDKKIEESMGKSYNADAVLAEFSDKDDVSIWAKELVAATVKSGYVGGSDGRLNPKNNIKRCEFASVMNKLVSTYVDKAGTYTSFPDGNVIIRSTGVNLKDISLKGDLIIGEGAKDGATIENVVSSGRLVVRSGEKNTAADSKFGTIRLIRSGVAVTATNVDMDRVYVCEGTHYKDETPIDAETVEK